MTARRPRRRRSRREPNSTSDQRTRPARRPARPHRDARRHGRAAARVGAESRHVAVVREDADVVPEDVAGHPSVHRDAGAAAGGQEVGGPGSRDEVELAGAGELIEAERHLEPSRPHLGRAERADVHEHVAPVAAVLELALHLELEVLTSRVPVTPIRRRATSKSTSSDVPPGAWTSACTRAVTATR